MALRVAAGGRTRLDHRNVGCSPRPEMVWQNSGVETLNLVPQDLNRGILLESAAFVVHSSSQTLDTTAN